MLIDFKRLFHDYGVPYNPNVNRGWYNVTCPMCHDRKDHGGFNLHGGYYHCWKCGGHELEWVLSRILNVPRRQITGLIAPYTGHRSQLDILNKRVATAKQIELPGGELTKAERKYLQSRRFDPDEIMMKYGVRGGVLVGPWKYRIIIPIVYQGRVVSYQGRDTTGQSALRYRTLSVEQSVIDPKDILYGLDACKTDHLCLVEGITDQWRMGDGFAATLGTSMKPAQLKLIKSRYRRVSFLFDPEAEAQARARKQAAQLAALGLEVEIVDTELDHDPGDMTDVEVEMIRRELGVR